MTNEGRDPMFEGWDQLDWNERRERRFQRWLSAPGVEFESDTARNDYKERVQLLIDAIQLRKPARVPVTTAAGYYVGKYSGLTKKEAMYDYERAAAALRKYHEDFRPDFQTPSVAPGRVFELLGLQFVDWPGGKLADETPWQYVEGEYMREDEYDTLIADPEAYFRRFLLPRFGSAFAPLASLPPFTDMMEATTMLFGIPAFADPAVVEGMQKLAEAARECLAYLMAMGAAGADAAGRLGIPSSFGGLAKAPYDILADTLRGTKGIMIDRFRQPEKILEASERLVPIVIEWCVRQATRPGAPLIIFVLHKGADGFMSDADFRTFYWPTLKAVMKGIIEQGIVPTMFAEGGYNKRLGVIADPELPVGSVLWLFDQTDMKAAKRALGGHSAIAGNVPTALLALSTVDEVKAYVTDLLDTCAKDGGFMLENGAVLDDAKAENLKAMIETGRNWRG
ncbi:MAG TPA: uroporphyrinogen decarboxylase family protein [Thermoleophilia bacterium]|nr:uroporphyrinogen decarboxylase family protein [Thermoleophilia bacterium]